MFWWSEVSAGVAGGMETVMYESYFARRLEQELELAKRADNLLERSIHLQACRYYRDLLEHHQSQDDSGGNDEARRA